MGERVLPPLWRLTSPVWRPGRFGLQREGQKWLTHETFLLSFLDRLRPRHLRQLPVAHMHWKIPNLWENSQTLWKWRDSPTCLVAPDWWPEPVERALGHLFLPPYVFGHIDTGGSVTGWRRTGWLDAWFSVPDTEALFACAIGLSVEQIAKLGGRSAKMGDAMRALLEIPSFKRWVLNPDWSLMPDGKKWTKEVYAGIFPQADRVIESQCRRLVTVEEALRSRA